jgi:hypothetical protein
MHEPTNNDGVSLWQENARCTGQDSEIFFESESHTTKAKAICNAGCPVKAKCLEYALLYDMSGVWGGTSEKDRRRQFKPPLIKILKEDAQESGTFNYALKS